jgi:hypothetical protein
LVFFTCGFLRAIGDCHFSVSICEKTCETARPVPVVCGGRDFDPLPGPPSPATASFSRPRHGERGTDNQSLTPFSRA